MWTVCEGVVILAGESVGRDWEGYLRVNKGGLQRLEGKHVEGILGNASLVAITTTLITLINK